MKRLTIKINNIITNQADFSSEEKIQEYLAYHSSYNTFGLPERPELDEQGQPTGNTLPAEYTIEITDITEELALQKEREEALKYLAETDWLIIREMDAGVPCPPEVKALRAAARLKV